MEISGFLKYSLLSPVEKKGIWKDMAFYGIAQIVLTIIVIAAAVGLALVPFLTLKGDSSSIGMTGLALLAIGALLLIVIYYIVGLYFSGRFYSFALNDVRITEGMAQVNSSYMARLFVAGLASFFHNMLFWRQKLLLLTYVPIVLGALAFVLKSPLVGAILLGIGFLAWFIAMIYHSIRLILLVPVALANPSYGYGQSSLEAWELVGKDNVLRLIAYWIAFAIVAMIVWAVVYVITIIAAYTVCLYPVALLIQVLFGVYIAYVSVAALSYIYAGVKQEKQGGAPAEPPVAMEIKPYEMPAEKEPMAEAKAFVMPAEEPKKAAAKKAAPKAKPAKKKAAKKR
ncbi:MAG: hypothetical protein WC506_01285 [Candidatus Micrarchaeia archaeon]